MWRSFVFMDLFRPTSFLVFLRFIMQRAVFINKKGACFLCLLMFPIRLFFSIYQAKMPQKLCRKFNFSCEKLSCSRVHDTANPSELKKTLLESRASPTGRYDVKSNVVPLFTAEMRFGLNIFFVMTGICSLGCKRPSLNG